MDNGFSDWIKIEEMEPPTDCDMLGYVVDKEFPEKTGIYMVAFLTGGWWVRYSEGSFPIIESQIISHWRFLPNPPRN